MVVDRGKLSDLGFIDVLNALPKQQIGESDWLNSDMQDKK